MPLPEFTAADMSGLPQYRFRGRIVPSDEVKREVRAELAQAPSTEEGVAKLRLYDVIDSWGGSWGVSAKEFAAALDSLDPNTHTIQLHINSPGGEVFEGIAILNQLRTHPARVVAVVDGLAASAASFIAAGADEVVMGQNAELMIHDAWGLCVGNAADMRSLADRLDHLSNNIASVYAGKAGGTVADWRQAMLDETWYSAQEAVDAGLANSVTETAPADAAQNAFDLSVFKHAGRAEAPAPKAPEKDEATQEAVVEIDNAAIVRAVKARNRRSDEPTAETEGDGLAAYWQRRHRMNERKAAASA
jgi:ATP-dependent Clp endopeptidase proteolytic subunit ClpP